MTPQIFPSASLDGCIATPMLADGFDEVVMERKSAPWTGLRLDAWRRTPRLARRRLVRLTSLMLRMLVWSGLRFVLRLETAAAPKTCAAFLEALPFRSKLVQARWSGEAAWIPLGDRDFGVSFENHTSHPAPGQILLYPGGYS